MRRDFGGELIVAIAAVGVIAFAVIFGIIVSLSNTNQTVAPNATFRAPTLRFTLAAAAQTTVNATDQALESVAQFSNTPTGTTLPTDTLRPSATPTDAPRRTETVAPTSTFRPTHTATLRPTDTRSPTATPSLTLTDTRRPTETATETPRPTNTSTVTPSATLTDTPRPTATETPRPTDTSTVTPSATLTDTPRPTNTPTTTSSPTLTDTPRPPTETPHPTRTRRPISAETTCAPPVGWVSYILMPTDTLYAVAAAARTSISELLAANCLSLTETPSAGTTLAVPRPLAPPLPTFEPAYPDREYVREGCSFPGAVIGLPLPGEGLMGVVPVFGTASSSSMAFYRIEVRPDVNRVYTLYYRSETAVVNGVLTELNTDLFGAGLHWLRLTVVQPNGEFPTPCIIPLIFG